jgi:hypothetical protein
MASELDSIWLAPTKEVALAQMNAIRGFSKPELDASFDEAWEVYRTHPDRAVPNTAEEQIAYGRTFQSFAEFATGITKKDVKHPATSIRAVTPELCEVWCALPGALKKRAARKMDGARIPVTQFHDSVTNASSGQMALFCLVGAEQDHDESMWRRGD